MSINKLAKDSRNRSYSDRVNFTVEGWKIFDQVASYLGQAKRYDYAIIDGLPYSKKPSFTVRYKDLMKTYGLQDVYAKAIVNDNDAQLSLAWRNLKANRRDWHKDVRFYSKQKGLKAERKLAQAEASLARTASGPRVCLGGRAYWRAAQSDPVAMQEFKYRRYWLGSVGRSSFTDKSTGRVNRFGTNPMIRLDLEGNLSIVVPKGLWPRLGLSQASSRVVIGTVRFNHGQEVIDAAIVADRSITYHVERVSGHWKLRAQTQLPLVVKVKSPRVMGIDLNNGHLDCWVIDDTGNPIGSPHTFSFKKRGVREAIDKALAVANRAGARTIVIEDLSGLQRDCSRGRGGALTKIVSGIPSGQVRSILSQRAEDLGFSLVEVNPAGTSREAGSWGSVAHRACSGHQVASYLIGRRGLGLSIYRVREADSGRSLGKPISVASSQGGVNNSGRARERSPG